MTRESSNSDFSGNLSLLYSIIENCRYPISVIDMAGKFRYVSCAAAEICGGTPVSLIGMNYFDFVLHEDIAQVKYNHRSIVEKKQKEAVFCYRIRCKDGNHCWLETHASLMEDEYGCNAIFIGRDITEERQRILPICSSCKKIRDDHGDWEPIDYYLHKHKRFDFTHGICPECAELLYPDYMKLKKEQMARKLREYEDKFTKAFYNNPEPMSICTLREKRHVEVNDAWVKTSGYKREESIGRTAAELGFWINKHDMEVIEKKISEDGYIRNLEICLRNKSGIISFCLYSVEIIDMNGEPHILCVSKDITERKQMEKMLRESETRYRAIFENTGTAMIIVEENMIVSLMNTQAEQLLGYLKNDIEGVRSWTEFIGSEDVERMKEYHRMRRIKPGEVPDNYEFKLINSKGEFRHIYTLVSMIPESKKSIASMVDVTDRKLAEIKTKVLLREKEIILKEVHHRIKNNMNTLRDLFTICSCKIQDPLAAKTLLEAENRVLSMMVLYDKLYCSHNFQALSIRTYLEPLVDEILNNFPEGIMINVQKQIEDFCLDARILFSLGIIVNELLTDIMKYAFTGMGKELITISAARKNNHVTVIICDEEKEFSCPLDFENSSGFGLQLVKMLTEQIRGTIRSEHENGTKFILEFDT